MDFDNANEVLAFRIGLVVYTAALAIYLLLGYAMEQCESVGYELTSGSTLGALLGVLTLIAAVAGLAMDPGTKQ